MNKIAIIEQLVKIDAVIATIDAADPLRACWEARRAEVAAKMETSKPAFKINQIVMVSGKTQARIVDIARNGIRILRSASDGEWVRTGLEQIRERVSAKTLTAA